MKHIANILSVVALAIFVVGCQADNTCDLQRADTTTLSVSIEQTRTVLGPKSGTTYPVYWSEGDCIAVNGVKSNAVAINAENRSRATFTINRILEHPYFITYPHTAATTLESPKVVFPAVQEYVNGSFATECTPMCAYVAEKSNSIALKHLAGVLRLAVRGNKGSKTALKMVTLTAERAISGAFDVECESGTLTPTDDCEESISVALPDNMLLSADKDLHIYIAIPHGEYGACNIAFTNAEGESMNVKWNGATIKAGIIREFKSLTFRIGDGSMQLEDMKESIVDEWGNEEGVTLKGYVRSNGEPLQGVVVSDGLLCTTTNINGFYSLKSDLANARFVTVSIPSGYSAPTNANGMPIFYHLITDGEKRANMCVADFNFNKIKNNAERFTILVGADPQPRAKSAGYDNNAYHSLDCCNDLYRDMREKAATITDRNVYGLMLGDIVHENMSLYDNYIAAMKSLGFPMFNILGNHDNDTTAKNDVEGRRAFEEKLGPTYYSFNIGKLHFVVLDNLIMDIDENGELTAYEQGLTDEIWQWLQNDLYYIDRSSTIMVAAHSPMFKLIDGGSRGAAHKNDYGYLFAEFAKCHVWTGHAHTTYNYNFAASAGWAPVEEHTVARSTGELWTNEYMSGGTPRGYTVVEVDGDDISWYFKPTIYQSGSFVSTKYTSKQPGYIYRDWNYVGGVAKMKADNSTLSEAYQMKVYKPRQYHNTYTDMIDGAQANNYVYVNVFLWDNKWEYPKYNGVEMEKIGYNPAYCLATYEIRNHYYTYGYKLKNHDSYGPNDNSIHTIFRAPESRASGTGTVTVTDRFGNNYSSTISW